jgi:hypothetical protein
MNSSNLTRSFNKPGIFNNFCVGVNMLRCVFKTLMLVYMFAPVVIKLVNSCNVLDICKQS